MIYFVRINGDGMIKIGFTDDLARRKHGIKSSRRARSVEVLGVIPGGRREEVEIHRRFAHLRGGRSEDFRPDPELLDFIESNTALLDVRSRSSRNDVTAKIDATILATAGLIACAKGISLAEYVSETLRPLVDRDFGEVAERANKAV